MAKAGIYKIINIVNNKIYIGSSVNLKSRKYNHFDDLSKNKHKNRHLQSSYNKYRKENFKFEIIEYIEVIENKKELKSILLEREQYYINLLIPDYNICRVAYSLLGVRRTKEFIEKLRLRMKGNEYSKGKKKSEKSARNLGVWIRSKPVRNIDTNKEFTSMREAANYYNVLEQSISKVCRGVRKKCGGYRWGYI